MDKVSTKHHSYLSQFMNSKGYHPSVHYDESQAFLSEKDPSPEILEIPEDVRKGFIDNLASTLASYAKPSQEVAVGSSASTQLAT